eukprot:757282-Hanusia_phi.AAC.1
MVMSDIQHVSSDPHEQLLHACLAKKLASGPCRISEHTPPVSESSLPHVNHQRVLDRSSDIDRQHGSLQG